MAEWQSISGFLEACAVYITMQLVRCAAFSVILAVLVMLLRKLCANYIFVKGMLWAFLLFLPFLGRLRMFYENEAVFSQTWWLTAVTMQFVWFDWIYMAGVFVSMIWIFGKWFRLRRIVGKMKIKEVCGQDISISEWIVTPFTVGLLKPRIGRIAGFRPYRRRQCAGIAVVLAVWMIAAAAAIWHGSYPRCSELDQVLVHDGAGRLLSQDMERLGKIISYDDRFVYVDREAFEQLLRESQADTGDGIFIVFGGFQKFPGVGGNADSCQYPGDVEDGDGTMVKIPYEKRKDSLAVALYKML